LNLDFIDNIDNEKSKINNILNNNLKVKQNFMINNHIEVNQYTINKYKRNYTDS